MPDGGQVLAGVIPAMLTPMSTDGGVDLERLPAYIDALISSGVSGLFVGGTMGEGPLLTTEEREVLAERSIQLAAGRVPVAVHVGSIRTSDAAELATHAAEAGAAAVAAVPPYYYPLSDDELVVYFVAIHRAAPKLPFYLYNLPNYCRNVLSPALITRLREVIPSLAGIKESSGDLHSLEAILALSDESFDVICGADHLVAQALRLGAAGSVSSGAAVFPELYCRLTEAAVAGRQEAERLQADVDSMQTVMSKGQRVARYKESWRLRGVDLGPVREPLLPVSPSESADLSTALTALGLLPVPPRQAVP